MVLLAGKNSLMEQLHFDPATASGDDGSGSGSSLPRTHPLKFDGEKFEQFILIVLFHMTSSISSSFEKNI